MPETTTPMKTKPTLVFSLMICFCNLEAMAQTPRDKIVQDIIAEHVARAVEKAMHAKTETLRADLKNELDSQFSEINGYNPGIIESYDSETKTATISVHCRHVVNGGKVEEIIKCDGIPVLNLAADAAAISPGETCIVFFSDPTMDGRKNLLRQAAKRDGTDILAIAGFRPVTAPVYDIKLVEDTNKYTLERTLKRTLGNRVDGLRADIKKHQRVLNELINNTLKDMLGGTISKNHISNGLATIQRELNE